MGPKIEPCGTTITIFWIFLWLNFLNSIPVTTTSEIFPTQFWIILMRKDTWSVQKNRSRMTRIIRKTITKIIFVRLVECKHWNRILRCHTWCSIQILVCAASDINIKKLKSKRNTLTLATIHLQRRFCQNSNELLVMTYFGIGSLNDSLTDVLSMLKYFIHLENNISTMIESIFGVQ